MVCIWYNEFGAGKTTILNMVAGLQHPDSGQIVLQNKILFDAQKGISIRPQLRGVGYIFQESRLFPHLTIHQNIRYGLHNLPAQQQRYKEKDIIDALGIEHLLARKPDGLSGGEKQRCALARAILASPKILLMDEPMAALDQGTRLRFLHFLKQLQSQYPLPIVYVSHDLASITHFADDVVVIEAGKCIAQGAPRNILSKMASQNPQNRTDLPNAFSARPIRHVVKEGRTLVRANDVELWIPFVDQKAQEDLLLCVYASDIILSLHHPEGLSASNICKGTIVQIQQQNRRVFVEVDIGISMMVELTTSAVQRLNLQKGITVYLIIKACAINLISTSE